MTNLDRRKLIKSTVYGGLVGLGGLGASSMAATEPPLPKRGEFVIRGAYVLTFDAALGDLPVGDIHVVNGQIVDVGIKVKGGGIQVDGAGFIAMPGFVDTHLHAWTSTLRGVTQDPGQYGYFAAKGRMGPLMTPEDTYLAVRLAMAQALNSGVTTVNNVANNISNADHADATLRAHIESGVRSRFSYGPPDGSPRDQMSERWARPSPDFADIDRLRQKIGTGYGEGLLDVGVQLRLPPSGPQFRSADPALAAKMLEAYRFDYGTARKMNLPIAVDSITNEGILLAAADGFLSPDFLCIHALGATHEARLAMKAAGAAFSSSPFTEIASLVDMPVTAGMLADGVLTTLSIDSTSNADSNMFTVARLANNLVRLVNKAPFAYTMRDALGLATLNGAKALGLEGKVGALRPGHRADMIMVRTNSLNMGLTPSANPYRLLISAQTEDVDTVVVDGRILKRGGKLVGVDVSRLMKDAGSSIARLRAQAKWPEVAF